MTSSPLKKAIGFCPYWVSRSRVGAVFMGALTYIGNGPNFMVQAIAAPSGVGMPTFFAYLAYSALILLPFFVARTVMFP